MMGEPEPAVDCTSNPYRCLVCGIVVSSEISLNDHLRGRQHQMNLDKRRAAERSVYVRGFPKASSKEKLLEFFSECGKVLDIWLSGNGIYAIVEFADAESAERVLHASEPLYLDGMKLTVKPRDTKPRTKSSKSKRHHHGDKTHAEPQPQAQKSKQNHPQGITGTEELLEFDPEVMQQLSSAKSAEDQLILISTHFKMPMSAVETHLTICKALSDELQVHFPSCMVVPFGAAISGHGTLTSDCDICLITQPTERERALFSGSGYHPPGLHGHPQHDAVIDFSHLPPSSPSREDSLASSSESSSATASPTQFPDKSHGDGGSRHDFDIVASCVRRMPQCSKILTIPYAQCPIVRFTFEPPGVHCDLSINNLLGPANTRLMQAYYQFDDRFALLVAFVRLWVKYNGPSRYQLNNYAVSLMLIYALQRCSPPVLPCLQNPGPWPKKMSWFGKHGFGSSVMSPSFTVGPWTCDFVPPESLLPSTNTQSPIDLLHHFFKFYSEWSGEEVVAIHCPLDKTLSLSEAKALVQQAQTLGYKPRPFKDLSPLIVQDPFQLDHNLCKALSRESYAGFVHHMKIAAELLASKKSLLPLFDSKEYQQMKVNLFVKPKRLVYSEAELKILLSKSQPFAVLAVSVDELDLKNATIHRSLSRVALKAIVNYLCDNMSFICSPIDTTGDQQMEEADSANRNVSGSTTAIKESSPHLSDGIPAINPPPKESVVVHSYSDSMLANSESSKPEASQCSSDGNEEKMEDSQAKAFKPSEPFSRKRVHSNDEAAKLEQLGETKRTKNDDMTVTTLDALRLAERDCQSDVYHCTAMVDTWTHRRQRLRQLQRNDDVMDTKELTDSLPSLPPLLCVRLSIDTSQTAKVVIIVDQLPPLNMNKFKTWLALINKELKRE